MKRRLESGISYTEFSYVLLQSMDFLNLYRDHGVTLQHGGSDQWGNITGGVELIRRVTGAHAHAFGTPLITKPDGTKYGKTEAGALWLDAEMMSPYAFYQFWLNVDDSQVVDMLKVFTFLSRAEIEELAQQTEEKPFLRAGQRALAEHVTTLVHGAEETGHVQAAAAALFGGGDLHALSTATLGAALREAGSASVSGEIPSLRRPDRRDRPGEEPRGRPPDHRRGRCLPQQRAGRGPRPGARRRATSWGAPGWCCGGARRPSRAWRSPRFELGCSCCLMFPLSPGSGGRQDHRSGLRPRGTPSRRTTALRCAGARTSHGATPDGRARVRLIFENSTVCHLVDELV